MIFYIKETKAKRRQPKYLSLFSSLKPSSFISLLILIFLSVRFLLLGSYPLMDPTESRYAEISREMMVLNDWITPHFSPEKPFLGKPPLTFWITTIGFKLFGVNELVARLPSFLESITVLLLTIFFCKKIYGRKVSLFSGIILASSGLFYVHSGFVSTDNTFGLFVTLSLVCFYLAVNDKSQKTFWWSLSTFVALALSVLSKGLLTFALVLPPFFILAFKNRSQLKFNYLNFGFGFLIFLLITIPWHVLIELRNPGFLNYYFIGEHFNRFLNSSWEGNLYGKSHDEYHGTIWLYALLGFFPWIFLIFSNLLGMKKATLLTYLKSASSDSTTAFLVCWSLTPLLLFTFAENILIPYVYPCLPPFSILLAKFLVKENTEVKNNFRTVIKYSLIMPIGFLFTAVTILPNIGNNRSQLRVINDYLSFQKDKNGELIYLDSKPYSADFYLKSNAKDISENLTSQLAIELKDNNVDCYAVKKLSFHALRNNFKNFKIFDSNEKYLLICEPQIVTT